MASAREDTDASEGATAEVHMTPRAGTPKKREQVLNDVTDIVFPRFIAWCFVACSTRTRI